MRRAALAVAAVTFAALPAGADGAGLDRTQFRYTRTLTAPGRRAVAFEPDARLLGHARVGLADLRVLDASGAQVPWRPLPEHVTPVQPVRLLNAGRQGNAAVALLDLGGGHRVHDRIVLDVPARDFVGRVTVFGADRRGGAFTRLGATTIYDVSGARHARSTVVVFAPTDFRYLSLRAVGIRAINGATVASAPARERFVERRAVATTQRQSSRRTFVTLDLGFRHVPLREVRITSSTPRYDRAVAISTSTDGATFTEQAYGRVFSFPGSSPSPLEIDLRTRYLRVMIENGDDEPLRDVRVRVFDVSHALLLERGHRAPLRLYYGAAGLAAPDYDFARLPLRAQGIEQVRRATLGPEQANASFRPPPDTRSFTAKHDWLVDAALALAAVVAGAAGLLALRRRA